MVEFNVCSVFFSFVLKKRKVEPPLLFEFDLYLKMLEFLFGDLIRIFFDLREMDEKLLAFFRLFVPFVEQF